LEPVIYLESTICDFSCRMPSIEFPVWGTGIP
jgi:hypothetical protein